MEKFFMKHWAVITFILTALIDVNQGFLESLLPEQWQVVLVRILGSLILAYQWNPKTPKKVISVSASDKKKGGGAIIPNKGL